jgi:hypothetical protein
MVEPLVVGYVDTVVVVAISEMVIALTAVIGPDLSTTVLAEGGDKGRRLLPVTQFREVGLAE